MQALVVGAKLSSYEILSSLGAGGMGEVYRARDTKLGRDVALKTLPASFTHDPERVARFKREAQMLATLNHPNIAGIYGIDEAPVDPSSGGAIQFLTLELVEGETLAERLTLGALPVKEAIDLARQVADALQSGTREGNHSPRSEARKHRTNSGRASEST
jgi:serine/threonine protein kinase